MVYFSILEGNMDNSLQDIAKMSFFQFLRSPPGGDLMLMFLLPGQPNPDQWDIHNRWWLSAREALDDKLGRRGDAPDWPLYVTWRSKLFMSIFLETQKYIVINITEISLEKLIWNFTAMRNILIDLKLVQEEDLKSPKGYFQKLAVMGELDSEVTAKLKIFVFFKEKNSWPLEGSLKRSKR